MDNVDFSYENPLTYLYNSIWHPNRVSRISINRRNYNVGKGTIDTQQGTYYIPIGEDAIVYAPNMQEIINSQNKKLNSTKSLVNTNTTPNLGGGLYQWMTENGLQSLASFKERKRLATQYGIPNYIGTAQQNAELQERLDFDLRQAETSGGRSGLRKGLDY